MKVLVGQTNFNSGEITPLLHGHTDINRYENGLETATNAVVRPHGPVEKRTGTQYIAEVKDSTKTTRLIRFQFSQDDAYQLEFGHNCIRVFKNKAQVLVLGTPYEIVTTYSQTEVFELQTVQFGNSLYISHYNHAPAQLIWNDDADWTLENIPFNPPATIENGFAPATTITPSATSGNGVNFTAGAATFLPADVGRQIINLAGNGTASIVSYTSTTVVVCDILEAFPNTSAIASGSWKIDLSPVAELENNGTQLGSIITINAVSTSSNGRLQPPATLTPGAVTGAGVTFTASVAVFQSGYVGRILKSLVGPGYATITSFTDSTHVVATINEDFPTVIALGVDAWSLVLPIDTFRSADVGRFILMNNGIAEITTITNAHQIKASVLKAMNSKEPTQAWSIEEEAWTSVYGYPRSIGLFQQRLALASTDEQPQTVWFSESGIFESIGIGRSDADGMQVDLTSAEVNEVQWMMPFKGRLAAGTTGSEVVLSNGSSGGPVTPTTISADAADNNGSNLQQAVAISNEVVYVQRSNRKLMSFKYDFNTDAFGSEDLLFMAEHLSESGIKQVAHARDPDSRIYVVLNNGDMLVGCYVRSQQVMGWTRFTTNGLFESVSVISTGEADEIWVVVNRTINGSTKRYIEVFDDGNGEDNLDGFSDCFLTYSVPKTITGITKANPAVVTSNTHGFSNGDNVKIVDVEGMTEVNGKTYKAANVAANTFELTTVAGVNVDSTGYTTYASGGEAHELVSTISGLSHLEGLVVETKTDGAVHAAKTVSGGSITLDSPAYEVVVGLGYEWRVKTLPKIYNLGTGKQHGQPSRYVRPLLRLYKSVFPMVNSELVPARAATDRMDNKVPLFTGDIEFSSLNWDFSAQLELTSSAPFPITLLGVYGSLEGGTL